MIRKGWVVMAGKTGSRRGFKNLIQPKATPYDPLEWERWPISQRAKSTCLAWIEQGFGAPISVYLFYGIKAALYCAGWIFFCQWNEGCSSLTESVSALIAFQKAIIWSCLFEGLGLGCGSGPLTARYVPPFGGALHFLKRGTFKRALFPRALIIGGVRRGWLDLFVYCAWISSALCCLLSGSLDHTSPALLILAISSSLFLLLDRVIFLAIRSEHYLVLIWAFFLGAQPISSLFDASAFEGALHPAQLGLDTLPLWLLAAVAVHLALWFWAGASKLNGHFATVVCVMLSNSPWCPHWIKLKMYKNLSDDVRPSVWAHLAGASGTLLEFSVPILLLFGLCTMSPAADAFTLQSLFDQILTLNWGELSPIEVGFLLMLALHLFITSNVPLGVPIEWNLCVVYGAWFLFAHHGPSLATSIQALSEPLVPLIASKSLLLLASLLSLFLLVIPLLGNLFPQRVPFLLSMRYYAGNWPYTVWLIKKGDALNTLKALPRSVPWIDDQLAYFYEEKQRVGIMGRVMGFRMMHLQGRLIASLLHRVETRLISTPLHSYFYCEGEVISGIYLGWNFGDGHLHNEGLLEHLHSEANFQERDVLCLCVEPEGWFRPSLSYRVIDAQGGLLLSGRFQVRDLKKLQPWEITSSSLEST